jgi:probable H4MPT-linked C1 transfer pathway protein
MTVTIGWDLGGAHVKAAVLAENGALASVAQRPCPLWLGQEHLERALRELAGGDSSRARHALTMTGELVDLFLDRARGVAAILEAFASVIDAPDVLVFAGAGFVDARTARASWSEVASANWLATAALVAGRAPDALVLDIGSTTTDVMLIANGRIHARGRDDHGRLAREELVYTGVVRTPVAAIADAVPFGGEWIGVMAEQFATGSPASSTRDSIRPTPPTAGRGRPRRACGASPAWWAAISIGLRRQSGSAWRAGSLMPRANGSVARAIGRSRWG